MAYSKKIMNQDRDRRIIDTYLAGGCTMQELADKEGISKQRVYQIVSRLAGADVPEDVTRDAHMLRLDKLIAEFIGLALGPAAAKVSPTGKIVVDLNGEIIPDYGDKILAGNLVLRLDESQRKLGARDLPKRREMEFTAAQQEALQWIQQFKETVVEGEVEPPTAIGLQLHLLSIISVFGVDQPGKILDLMFQDRPYSGKAEIVQPVQIHLCLHQPAFNPVHHLLVIISLISCGPSLAGLQEFLLIHSLQFLSGLCLGQ